MQKKMVLFLASFLVERSMTDLQEELFETV